MTNYFSSDSTNVYSYWQCMSVLVDLYPTQHLVLSDSLTFNSQAIVEFPDSSVGKEPTCNSGDPGSIPGSGRSPGEGIGYPLQYSGLENSMDCIAYGVTKSQTRLSSFHFHLSIV